MSEKKISYLNRTYEDYKQSLIEIAKKYYPNLSDNFDDASIGSFLIDMAAVIGDNLSFHIDRVLNETNIESTSERESIYAIARSNGFKIPGPKGSIAEEKFTCVLPVVSEINNPDPTVGMPNWAYAPVIKKGTKVSSGSKYFELTEDIDFNEQFDSNGVSNRNILLQKDSNNIPKSYIIEKFGTVIAGETKIYKQVINTSDVVPFMEIIIPDTEIMNIESIIFKDGVDYTSDPSIAEFMNQNEFVPASDSPYGVDTYRFFEVNSLLEQYRWGDDITTTREGNQNIGMPTTYTYGYYDESAGVTVPTQSVTKGEWVPLTQKFITEYTDNGYLKIIFGSGEVAGQTLPSTTNTPFTLNQMSNMIRNNFLGKLPDAGWTMYVMYRRGGGRDSNVAENTINKIAYLNAEVGRCVLNNKDVSLMSTIRNSISCTNTTPSVSGKDAPTVDEIKAMIKYNNGAQERCITLKDYVDRVNMMPPRYGSPFRVGAIEENNKIMLYLLGIDNNGKLSDAIPEQLIRNIQNYLSMYRAINDFVEIKSARIINVSFEYDLYIDKNYNTNDVVANVIKTVKDYMDVNKHQLDDDIYVGDIDKEVSKVDGVLNVIDTRVYNEFGVLYSQTRCSQETYNNEENNRSEINLSASDYILVSDADEIFEIKYPESDIRCRVKLR